MVFVSMLLLVLLLTCFLCYGDDRPLIKPSQLMVGTVLDMTSKEITRDAFNLIKTLRTFGGSLNNATIVVGVTGNGGSTMDNTVLPMLAALDVKVIFIPQSPPHLAKTLNKFRMFEAFDSIEYDYFLWLDADIVVFEDPMPYLHLHKYPGSIECVPDFYSYLQRYPTVNKSSEYWNPNLPSFQLLGAGETAPHGICNTGVLYFDSLSLSTFLSGLQIILANTTYMNLHGKDRFIDSLIFTHVVSNLELDVTTLSYALNYMALFEIEIQEELVNPRIVLAHMLSDTELHCNMTITHQSNDPTHESSQCACVYRNKLMPPKGSLLREVIQSKILNDPNVCAILAGIKFPPSWPGQLSQTSLKPNAITVSEIAAISPDETLSKSLSENPGVQCQLVSPPVEGAVYHINSKKTVNVDVTIRCIISSESSIMLPVKALISKNEILVGDTPYYNADIPLRFVDHTQSKEQFKRIFDASYTVSMNVSNTPPRGPNYRDYFVMKVSLSTHKFATANLTVLYDSLVPPGQVHYSNNALMSPKAILMESQLFLPEYLNDRSIRGTGVIICCESRKGLAVTENLIRTWNGEDLLIVLESTVDLSLRLLSDLVVPEEERLTHLETVGKHLSEVCTLRNRDDSSKPLNCYIVSPAALDGVHAVPDSNTSFNWRIGSSLRPNSANFVYVDYHASLLLEQFAILEVWMKVLRKNGIIIGGRYPSAYRPNIDVYTSQGKAAQLNLGKISSLRSPSVLLWESRRQRNCADALAASVAQSLLVTYAERDPANCDAFCDVLSAKFDESDSTASSIAECSVWECSPAWYLYKLRV